METVKREPIPYFDSVEVKPSDEGENIARAIQSLESLLRGSGPEQYRHGHIHGKTHAVVQGEFRVLPNLPEELAQGVFARERTYQAIARFSNSASRQQADYIPDGRGMAIKLLDVEGPTLLPQADDKPAQDFVMINHPVFFASNVKEFLRLEEVLTNTKEQALVKAQKALTGGAWNPFDWHWRTAVNALQNAAHLPTHPANNTYFSMTPIRFGRYVAKYRVRPAGDLPVSFADVVSKLGTQADAMRLMLEETLKSQQILFEFQVQLRTSDKSMPVEDASVEWPEWESPFRTVALFLIPRQEITEKSPTERKRQLSFSVWHALEDHRPLGGINRLRKVIYPISAAWRLQEAPSAGQPV